VKIHRNDKPATEELQKSYINITGVTKALQNKNSPQITWFSPSGQTFFSCPLCNLC